MIFGSCGITRLPQEVSTAIYNYVMAGHEIIMADEKGVTDAASMLLSSIGANDKGTIYVLDREKYSNNFVEKRKRFKSEYDVESKVVSIHDEETGNLVEEIFDISEEGLENIKSETHYKELVRKQLIMDCDFGICVWDGDTKRDMNTVNRFAMIGKTCYVSTLA